MKQIGEGRTADIYDIQENKILKLYKNGFPSDAIQDEFLISQFVHSLGISTPQPYEMTSFEHRYGILFQRVMGISLLNIMKERPWLIKKHSRTLAALHYNLHTYNANGLEKQQREVLSHNIMMAPLLTEEEKVMISDYLDKLPVGNKLCHGDFHPDNILVGERKWIIDWMTGMAGNPLCDVARTVILLSFGSMPEGKSRVVRVIVDFLRNKMKQEYIRHYLQLSRKVYSDIERWELPVAAARLGEWIPRDEKQRLLKLIRERLKAIS